MNLDRQSFAAIALCFLTFIGYEYYLNQKYPDRFAQKASQETVTTQTTEKISAPPASSTALTQGESPSPKESALHYASLSAADLTIENNVAKYTFNQDSGSIVSITLKDYLSDDKTSQMEMIEHPLRALPLLKQNSLVPDGFEAIREGKTITFSRIEDGWKLSHSITVPENGYGVSLKLQWQNIDVKPLELKTGLLFEEEINHNEKKGGFFSQGAVIPHPAVLITTAQKTERYDSEKYCKDATSENTVIASAQNFDIDLFGFDRHYFVTAFMPENKRTSYQLFHRTPNMGKSCQFSILTLADYGSVAPLSVITSTYKGWVGPKAVDAFAAYDERLKETVDLGFFGMISRPLLTALRFIEGILGNWGLAIIFLTILLKFLFYPLTRQAAVSMHNMKKFQPEMNRIKEKYKDDQRMQQQELMRFMGTHKINPMKGCLPILPQIPVFFAFYRVLSTSIELRHVPFYGWIFDLSAQDPFYITPLLLGVTMFIQQKLTPATGMDKTQERIMMMLPIIFTAMMLTLPAGMVLYMLTNTVISIGQQQWLNRRLR